MPMGGAELLIILVIILLFFGAKRIPELARSLGKGTREFRKGVSEDPDHGEDEARQLPEGESRQKASPNGSASRDEKAKAPRIEQDL